MKFLSFIILLIFSFSSLIAQVVTSDPSMIVEGKPITLLFDASLGSKGLKGYAGDVYAHIGVITDKSVDNSDWKYVVSNWGENLQKTKLVRTSADKYQLLIPNDVRTYFAVPQNEKILKIAMVFRSGTLEGASYIEGKDDGGKDILINVYDKALTAEIIQPQSGSLVSPNEMISVTGTALESDGLKLYLNNDLLHTTTTNSITYSFAAPSTGTHTLKLEAFNDLGSVYNEISFYIHEPAENQVMPSSWRYGVNPISDTEVAVVLQAPHKEYVYLIGDFNNWEPRPEYQMLKDGELFWIVLDNLSPNETYGYQYYIDGDLRLADPYTNLVLDPWNDRYISESVFPNLKDYPVGKTEGLVSLFETAPTSYVWKVENFYTPPTKNMTFYEVLIRDFTTEGTIQAVTQKLDYLKELGVNAIELMPFNEFEGNDSWGYNPSFYFATDKAYGTPDDYKAFIDACHERGMAVIMDMVLNHSFSQSPLAQMYWEGNKPAANNPWHNREHNMKNPDAQWGYDFNHESAYTEALVDSILSFWMSEYKIDGFRFDFTKGFTNTPYGASSWASEYDASRIAILKRMVDEMWKRKSDAIAIFEHLSDNSEETVLADHGILMWGNLNHNFSEGVMGYNTSGKSDLSWGSYVKRGWSSPSLVTYMESHDEERVTYKAINYGDATEGYSVKDLPTALNRHEAAAVLLFSIPGPKLIWQFGELGYDVSIDDGGRLGKKPVRWEYLDDPNRAKLRSVYKSMLNLRETEEPFSTSDFRLNVSGSTKTIELNHSAYNVRVAANLSLTPESVNLHFSHTGWWFNHFEGDSLYVSEKVVPITISAGDYKLFSSIKMPGFVSTIDSSESADPKIVLFPNPVVKELNIETELEINKVFVYSMEGVKCMEQLYSSTINVGQLPAGQYIIQFKLLDGSIKNKRFVKKSNN